MLPSMSLGLRGLGFRVQGLGFKVRVPGFRAYGTYPHTVPRPTPPQTPERLDPL